MTSDAIALEQVRVGLLARRAELQQRRQRIGLDLSRRHEPLSKDFDDRAIQLENDEPLQAIGNAAVLELADIDAALDRLALGLYGVCRVCGERISVARLAAVPHASICQQCCGRGGYAVALPIVAVSGHRHCADHESSSGPGIPEQRSHQTVVRGKARHRSGQAVIPRGVLYVSRCGSIR